MPVSIPAPWRKRLIATAASVAGLYLLAWQALPLALKPALESQASQALGRAVTLQGLSFNPWSLELTLSGLRVATADGSGSQLAVERVRVNAELASVWRLAPVLDAVDVDNPVLQLTLQPDSQLDVQDMLDRLSPPDQPPPTDTAPPRMAVYNVAVRSGSITLKDGGKDLTHSLSGLELSIPFIHTLGTAQEVREVRVQPHLAFVLNGSHFETTTSTQPFGDSLATQTHLSITGLDLAPYLPYLPARLPARPTAAVLGADLQLAFTQLPTPTATLTGTLNASGVALADGNGQPLLTLAHAHTTLADVRPLQRVAMLDELTLTEPTLNLSRDAQGRLNVAGHTVDKPQNGTNQLPKYAADKPYPASATGTKSLKNTAPPTEGGWALGVARLQLSQGRVNWSDAATPDARSPSARATRLQLGQLALTANRVQWPLPRDVALATEFELSADLIADLATDTAPHTTTDNPDKQRTVKRDTQGKAPTQRAAPARLSAKGHAAASEAQAQVGIQSFALPWVAPYLQALWAPSVQGQLDADTRLNWSAATGITVDVDRLALSQLRLQPDQGEAVSLRALEVRNAHIDPQTQRADLGHITLTQPTLTLHRLADGHWMFEPWLRPTNPTNPTTPTTTEPTAAAGSPAPWAWQLAELAIKDGQVGWRDDAAPTPVVLSASAWQLNLKALASRGTPPSAQPAAPPATLTTSLRLAAGDTEPGTLDWRGTLTLGDDGQTPQARGQLVAQRLPAHALAPYAAHQLNLRLLRADTSFSGSVAFSATAQGPKLQVAGDATLEDFRANTLATAPDAANTHHTPPTNTTSSATPGEEWLHWKTLNLKGLSVQVAPATAPQIDIQSGALSDFFARIAIQENGRINLQDILKSAATAAPSAPTLATPPTPTPAPSPTSASSAALIPVAQAPDPLAPAIRIGPFSLVNGAVNFSDRFIRPNYQADLSELTGRLGGFSSQVRTSADGSPAAPEMAELELRGKAEGTASLDITGRVNPLAQPLALDIQGKVRNLELPPLSPYTIKYTGHGIERGKLSLDVAYTVLPNGQLTARNQLVLNQLSFGEAVPGAPASLPVRLAVALLADRHGMIDLDLPIQGSLNDPEFSLVPVIFKVIGNVIVKAITAPFSLLANALGGGADALDHVAFPLGSAQLSAASEPALAKLAQALLDRPNLNLTVVGHANLDAERSAYQLDRLNGLLRAERLRSLPAPPDPVAPAQPDAGASPPSPQADGLPATERPRWLAAVYRRTDMPKPRNALGLAKELTPEDTEALLLAQIPVPEAAMRTLAVQRAVAVRDALLRLQVPASRLFQGMPVTQHTPSDRDWQPRADMALAAK